MDRGFCGQRNRCGMIASWGCGASKWAGTGPYQKCWKRGIDIQTARERVSADFGCSGRQSERSLRFGWWGQWRRWWWYRAERTERRWWTRRRDGHYLQKGSEAHWEILADADGARPIDTPGMVGRSQLHPWKRRGIEHNRTEGFGKSQTACTQEQSYTWTLNIWGAYGGCWYHPRNIAKAASDVSTRKLPYEATFWETTVE